MSLMIKNTKKQQSSPGLPEEIIQKILRGLPAKSLVRCRCVSNPWNIQIKDPDFFKSCNKFSFILRHGFNKLYTLEYDMDDSSASHSDFFRHERIKEIRYPFCFPKAIVQIFGSSKIIDVKILGCFNGLVCLSYFLSSCHLLCFWNPYTEEYKIIPMPYGSLLPLANGFGYDSKTDDYHLVNITMTSSYVHVHGSDANVYSLKSNSWKRLYIPYEFPISNGTPPGLFFNGAFHWFAKNLTENLHSSDGGVLIALDAGKRVVQEITQPESPVDVDGKYMDVLGGCLCVLVSTKTGNFEVWVMKDYGVRALWAKVYSIPRLAMSRSVQCLRRMKCLKNEQILLEIEYGWINVPCRSTIVVSHDLKNNCGRVLMFGPKGDYSSYNSYISLNLEIYEKSLVSLNSGTYVGNIEQEQKVLSDELVVRKQGRAI